MTAPALLSSLKDLCIKAVSANFQHAPTFGGLPGDLATRVTDGLPLTLPLHLAASMISDESYWKRRACMRWKNCITAPHGRSWKQLYMEQNLQEALEQFDTATGDLAGLRSLMTFSQRFVHCLRLQQLPSHLDLQLLFDAMENTPSSLSLNYSLQAVGMDYDRAMFGMKLADCRCLARALARTETLVALDLTNNCIDDDKTRMLASGLADNISITHLNLSHNRISDRGLRALAKLIDKHSVISWLDLSDNQLHTDSGRALGRALVHSQALVSLNLRLNRLGDEGCEAICDALCHPAVTAGSRSSGNSSQPAGKTAAPLEQLNMSSNGAGVGFVPSLCNMLRYNKTLVQLDVSSNSVGEQLGQELLSAVAGNAALMGLDVRGCGLSGDVEEQVQEQMLSRLEKRERSKLLGTAAK